MWETWVQSLAWEDPQEKGTAIHSSILAWRIPWTVHVVAKSWTRLSDFHSLTHSVGSVVKNQSICQCRRHVSDPWVRKIAWRGKGQPAPIFLPRISHGQRSLAGLQSLQGSQRIRHDWSDGTCSHKLALDHHPKLNISMMTKFLVVSSEMTILTHQFWPLTDERAHRTETACTLALILTLPK